MATAFQGLRTAIYFVTDMDKARDWYVAALGIPPYFDELFYIGFNVGGYELGLHPAQKDAPLTGGVAVYWGVSDVATTYQTLIAAGAAPYEEPNDVGGNITVAAVKDPWGNVLGIIDNPHFALPA